MVIRHKGEKSNNWKGGKPKCECGVIIGYNNKQCKNCYILKLKSNPPLKGFKHTDESKEKIRNANIGKKLSKETIQKLVGKIPWNYIEDRTKLKKFSKDNKQRKTSAYNNWSRSVKNRDNYICRISNKDCCGILEAHHILPFRDYPELRFIINNGITLCHAHHPRGKSEEKRLEPLFMELVSVSKNPT